MFFRTLRLLLLVVVIDVFQEAEAAVTSCCDRCFQEAEAAVTSCCDRCFQEAEAAVTSCCDRCFSGS